jgi:DNA-directed RNA polymerase subunit RPC12/RpoP
MKEQDKKQPMWCSECEHLFETEDYSNCVECEKCKSKTVIRVGSTSFVYAFQNKQREKELISFLMFLRKNTTEEKAKSIVRKYMINKY